MTEKRFTYLDASRNKCMGSFFCNGVPLTNDEVVDLLNKQDQRINELEERIQELEESLGFCRDLLDGTCNSTRMKQLHETLEDMVKQS